MSFPFVSVQLLELNRENDLVPNKVNYKAITTGKTVVNQILGQKKTAVPKKSRATEPSPTVIPPYQGPQAWRPRKSSLVLSKILPRMSPRFFVLGLSEPCLHKNLRFREATYPPPPFVSEGQVTDNSTSQITSSLAADRFKNCMLRPEVLSAMGKLKAEMGVLSSSLDASKADIEGVRTSLQESVLENEALALKFSAAEKSSIDAVETIKGSYEYQEFLKDNMATLVKEFCQGVSRDFPRIDVYLKKYVNALGDEYVTELFEDLPDEMDYGDEDDEDAGGSDQEYDIGYDQYFCTLFLVPRTCSASAIILYNLLFDNRNALFHHFFF
ncbi:hypothetical protein LIER_29105 [Lithospermum erythrorhizon]|uniref:Uncharacterized protein n=1 Tax=Lithospermum erythrorhizon TaxID=34254 RepID=A0AAV3RL37_LITER